LHFVSFISVYLVSVALDTYKADFEHTVNETDYENEIWKPWPNNQDQRSFVKSPTSCLILPGGSMGRWFGC